MGSSTTVALPEQKPAPGERPRLPLHGCGNGDSVWDIRSDSELRSDFVGTSHDTPQFAVECISRWWCAEGRRRYPGARRLLILADGGGSNGPTCRLWKERIQADLCDRYGISVTVSHYPTGASKWNIIEHRLFSEISKEWAGRPLDRYGTILNYIRRTKTEQGLTVTACLIRKKYSTGIKVTDEEMKQLRLVTHPTLPRWNYTLRPRKNVN